MNVLPRITGESVNMLLTHGFLLDSMLNNYSMLWRSTINVDFADYCRNNLPFRVLTYLPFCFHKVLSQQRHLSV